MRTALTAAALAVAIGHLWLVVTSWKSRSVLAGFLGATGIAIVLFAVVAGPARNLRAGVLISDHPRRRQRSLWPRPVHTAAARQEPADEG